MNVADQKLERRRVLAGPVEVLITRFESPSDSHSFIIRLWQEWGNSEETTGVWRGSITHVQTQERHYFQTFTQLAHILAKYIGTLPT